MKKSILSLAVLMAVLVLGQSNGYCGSNPDEPMPGLSHGSLSSGATADDGFGRAYQRTPDVTPGLSQGGLLTGGTYGNGDLGRSYEGVPNAQPGLSHGNLPPRRTDY